MPQEKSFLQDTDAKLGSNTVRVSLEDLSRAFGVVARDVVGPDGVVILPSGVDISIFDASIGAIVRKLRQIGVDHVYLTVPSELSADDISRIIDRVYSDTDSVIDKQKAGAVVRHVDTLFHGISQDDFDPAIVEGIHSMGDDLTDDLMKDPHVTFSLGKVRDADEYTFIHSFNVSLLCGYLANRLYPGRREFVRKMVVGGMLHDLGKAQIPLEVLNKPGPLTQEEFAIMQRHPALGVVLAVKSGVTDRDIIAVIGGHHEKWSGKGYPDHKAGTDIPETARIAAVADVFDALTAKRVYKQPMSSRNAISIILKDAGTHFDVKVARALLTGIGLYPPGSLVRLSDGRQGIVTSGGGGDLMRPVVMIQPTRMVSATDPPEFVDLRAPDSDVRIVEYLGHGDKRDVMGQIESAAETGDKAAAEAAAAAAGGRRA